MEFSEQIEDKSRAYHCEFTSSESTRFTRALAFYYIGREKELDETVPALRDVAYQAEACVSAGETVKLGWSTEMKSEVLGHLEKALSEYAAALLIAEQLRQARGKTGLKKTGKELEQTKQMARRFTDEVLANNLTSSIARYESEA